MSRNLPRLLLCAPASGGGKTTVTCALLQALVNRGLEPVAFKCGPDYIDPMFHSEVIGAKSRNLDLFFLGRELTRRLLWENGSSGQVAVIEGVMGYYDGIAMSGTASAWDLAGATDTPAVLVVDARGRALSAAALIKGFLTFRTPSRIRGILLNRVSSMLYPQLKKAIEGETGVPVYGYLPELPDCALESRHLGLVTAAEVDRLREKLAALAEQAERSIDLDGLLALSRTGTELEYQEEILQPVIKERPKIAVAKDEAFCFYYADALSCLASCGAELVYFSPLRDPALPEDCSGLYLGGGYPELYAHRLSGNRTMLRSVRQAIEDGMPAFAECGGFLYLHASLEDEAGRAWPMTGVFSAQGVKTTRLGRFGYVTLTAQSDGLLGPKGTQLPAHEFHYWDSTAPGRDFAAQKPQSDRSWACAYHTDSLYAGFPHFHFRAVPGSAARFVAAAAAWRTLR